MRPIQLYLSHTRCQDSQSHSCFLCFQAPQQLVWDNLLMLTYTLSFTNYTICNVSYIFILFPISRIPSDWLQGCWTISVFLTTQFRVITRNLGLCECVLPSALFLTIPFALSPPPSVTPAPHRHICNTHSSRSEHLLSKMEQQWFWWWLGTQAAHLRCALYHLQGSRCAH